MFDATNKTDMMQSLRSRDSGYRINMIARTEETSSDQKASIGIDQKRDADKEISFRGERRIYWGVFSPEIEWSGIFSKYKYGSAVFSPLYRSINGDEINAAMLSRIDELYGGEEKMFKSPQAYAPISVQDESDLIMTELAKIEVIFGKKPFIDAYELAQHTFDESDKEWDVYLREERKRQAMFDES